MNYEKLKASKIVLHLSIGHSYLKKKIYSSFQHIDFLLIN